MVDSAHWGPQGFCPDATSLRGQGARIDLAFVDTTAASSLVSYCLEDGITVQDHKMVHLSFHSPLAGRTWYMPKCAGLHGAYLMRAEAYSPPRISSDQNVHIALKKLDVTVTLRTSSGAAEQNPSW